MARAQVVPGLLGVGTRHLGLEVLTRRPMCPTTNPRGSKAPLAGRSPPVPAPHHTRAPGTSRWLTWLRIGPRRRSKRKSQSKSCFGRPELGPEVAGSAWYSYRYACNPLKPPPHPKSLHLTSISPHILPPGPGHPLQGGRIFTVVCHHPCEVCKGRVQHTGIDSAVLRPDRPARGGAR